MKKSIIVFCAGGHAKVVIDILRESNHYAIVGVADPSLPKKSDFYGLEVIGKDSDVLTNHNALAGVVALGCPKKREQLVRRILSIKPRFEFIRAVHPAAYISPSAKIGVGSVIMPGVSINADVTIGAHCVINTNASIDHDSVLGDYVNVSPNVALAGGVVIESGVLLGTGATVIPSKNIARGAVIAAGAVVIKDIPANAKALGVPAVCA